MPRGSNTTTDETAIRAALAAKLTEALGALGHALAELARDAQGAEEAFRKADARVAFWTQAVARASANGAFDQVPDDVRGLGARRNIPSPPGEEE